MKYIALLFLSAAVVTAQDFAPESIAHHAANFAVTPAVGETATVLAGLFTAGQSYRFTSSGAPLSAPLNFTWTKTGPTTGTLVEADSVRTLTSALTFTAPLTATFRTTSSVSPAAQTGTLTLAPIPQSAPPLVNLSTRATLGAGQVLTPGFVVGGTVSRRVLVRAIGPTLTRFGVTGVMADPSLTIFRSGVAAQIASNNNWGGSATLVNTFAAVSAFALPLDSLDAALLLTLAPGAYTAQVQGTGAGEVIVEVYFVD
jgi:hypothetical protein